MGKIEGIKIKNYGPLKEVVLGRTLSHQKPAGAYTQIGIAKCEWAKRIGAKMSLTENASPSYRFFIGSLIKRVEDVNLA